MHMHHRLGRGALRSLQWSSRGISANGNVLQPEVGARATSLAASLSGLQQHAATVSPTTTIGLRHNSSSNSKTAGSADFLWVPEAYRGLQKGGGGGRPQKSRGPKSRRPGRPRSEASTKTRRRRGGEHPSTRSPPSSSSSSTTTTSRTPFRKRRQRNKWQKDWYEASHKFLTLQWELVRLVQKYRDMIGAEPLGESLMSTLQQDLANHKNENKRNNHNNDNNNQNTPHRRSDWNAAKSPFLTSEANTNTMAQILDVNLHVTEQPVTWDEIYATENVVRALCRTLHDMTQLLAELAPLSEDGGDSTQHNNNSHNRRQQQSRGQYTRDDGNNNNGLNNYQKGKQREAIGANLDRCLRHLFWLRSDRALLVERVRNATQYPHQPYPRSGANQFVDGDGNAVASGAPDQGRSPGSTTMQNWVASMWSDVTATSTPHQEEAIGVMAHEDPSLGVTNELFTTVIDSISTSSRAAAASAPRWTAWNAESNKSSYIISNSPAVATAKRMAQLLEAMPTDFVPRMETVQTILAWQVRAGTLDSAETAWQIFQQHPERKHRLSLVQVLQAYRAALHTVSLEEKVPFQERQVILDEALQVQKKHWEERTPGHRVERIAQCATLLHCMVLQYNDRHNPQSSKSNNDNKDSKEEQQLVDEQWAWAYQEADDLMRRMLDAADYSRLQTLIHNTDDDEGDDDGSGGNGASNGRKASNNKLKESANHQSEKHLVPILNFLSQLYAIESSNESVAVASRLLDHLLEIHQGSSSSPSAASSTPPTASDEKPSPVSGRRATNQQRRSDNVVPIISGSPSSAPLYPNTDTFDALFAGIARNMSYQSKKKTDAKDRLATLDYCTNLLQYMYLQDEPHCLPGNETFGWMMLLIRSVNPPDLGSRAQDVLGMAEVREATAHGTVLQLKHYHHALACWLAEAESVAPSDEEEDDAPPRPSPCQQALAILTRMEIQSIPLLLNERELVKVGGSTFRSNGSTGDELYPRRLRPSRKTYRLVLDTCFAYAAAASAAPNEKTADIEEAVRVAQEVYQRMLSQQLQPDTPKRALELAGRLPVGDPLREEFEALVLSTIAE